MAQVVPGASGVRVVLSEVVEVADVTTVEAEPSGARALGEQIRSQGNITKTVHLDGVLEGSCHIVTDVDGRKFAVCDLGVVSALLGKAPDAAPAPAVVPAPDAAPTA